MIGTLQLTSSDADEPPYFLPHESSNDSNEMYDPNRQSRMSNSQLQSLAQRMLSAADNDSDEYRSVIDDLTIENKKLKEKLRRYESIHSTHLEKDKLFEVKIHSLPASKRRELEDTLRSFASSIDGGSGEMKSVPRTAAAGLPSEMISTSGTAPKRHSSSSSNSRQVDSAYASMSNSDPTSIPKSEPPTKVAKNQNIQSFLQDIPEGLLPKHAMAMTERQKKKLIVRRLEQIFTGKVKGIVNLHSQHVQQQEVSNSAALANRPTKSFMPEGLREANILPRLTEVDQAGQSRFDLSRPTVSPELSGSGESPDAKSTPSQRPTRPLDLDPDREQNPTDNVEYIRHLGLSTPQLITEDSSDAEPGAEGWVYLNLLINMAQLHIMNVTPDVVRSAISEISTRFQLSSDGQRIRWRGGSAGTRLSSDSDSPRDERNQEYHESVDDRSNRKRRKTEVYTGRSTGHFASIPVDANKETTVHANVQSNDAFYYKPLFHHKTPSEEDMMTLDDRPTSLGSSRADDSGPNIWGHKSSTGSLRARRQDEGPIVFYSGAPFCTDLSCDRTNIMTPVTATCVDKDGFSNDTDNALGCNPQRPITSFGRTPSGSLLPLRPFKASTKGMEMSPASQELITCESRSVQQDESDLPWASDSSISPLSPVLIGLSASGIGGTQPADHFAMTVQTRRTKLDKQQRKTPCSPVPGIKSRKIGHSISKAALDLFRETKNKQVADDITERLASMSAFFNGEIKVSEQFPIKSEMISTRLLRLQPSELPEPINYYGSTSSSDDGSEADDITESSLHRLKIETPYFHRSAAPLSNPDVHSPAVEDYADEEDIDDDDDESSIDMLAAARELDPEMVAAREREFRMEVDSEKRNNYVSSAATVDGSSGDDGEDSD